MKTYVTFGQTHVHRIAVQTFDRNCVAVIHCKSPDEGRALAFERFRRVFCFEYPEADFLFESMHYYPRGFITVKEEAMSYDIKLQDPVTNDTLILDAPHQMRGGTYAVGGTDRAALNVTYNYAPHFYATLGNEGIRELYGKTGAESMAMLKGAIAGLDDDVSDDYWQSTEGNAKQALAQLLALATLRPDGVWAGD